MSTDPKLPSAMGQAALTYARRGWPVFPCRERDGEPFFHLTKKVMITPEAKSPYLPHGLNEATTDEPTILRWWRRWPKAMIGLPLGGATGIFAVDFDPRDDEATGEEWTLPQLKADLEAQMGVPLPRSLTVRTPSGGVHVYLRQPDGEPIRNRGALPLHVDVRGKGGYVIVPPSICEGGAKATAGRYRYLDGRHDEQPVEAPAELIAILRAPKASAKQAKAGDAPAGAAPSTRSSARPMVDGEDPGEAAKRRYAMSALDEECRKLAATLLGQRNNQCNASGFAIGQLVGADALGESFARAALNDAVAGFNDPDKARVSIDNGLAAGMEQPRDLSDVADRARERASRPSRASPRPRAPDGGSQGEQSFRVEGTGGGDHDPGAGGDEALHRRCIFKPHTDLGNAERFFERFGRDFRWSPALGWMGWDGRRWVTLDQDEKNVPPVVLDKVFDTVRAIQDEAELIRDSGMAEESASGLERVIWLSEKRSILRSEQHAKWGRTSEGAGKLSCIARLAQPWIAVKADAFDADPLAINVLNGTLRFRCRIEGAPGTPKRVAEWKLEPHRREDLISKLAPITLDRDARCPIYDDMLAWAQPDPAMRRYLHQWAGLNLTGDMGSQILHFWYGRGGNGKSTTIDAWAACAGDYATTVPIETFLDQGIKKRGDQATPDLARLGGVRMLRTSEPERGAKLAAALIKLVTGGEPLAVRFLNRGFFDLRPIFKLTISGNYRPEIPDTDDGIWRRVKLIPWEQRVRDEQHPEGTREKDPDLPRKLLGELPGIFNRLMDGLLDWLANGLVEPEHVTAATQEYRTQSDPLARFLKLCTRPAPGRRVQSSKLHELFVAWCKAAGEREWTNKGFAQAMLDKGMKKKASDGMQWLDIEATRQVSDFVDEKGEPKPFSDDDEQPPGPAASSRAPPSDDDYVPGYDDDPPL